MVVFFTNLMDALGDDEWSRICKKGRPQLALSPFEEMVLQSIRAEVRYNGAGFSLFVETQLKEFADIRSNK